MGFSKSRRLCYPHHHQEAVAASISNAAAVLPVVLWMVALTAGAARYDGKFSRSGHELHLPLQWYDDIFKVAGPFLPLLPFAARCLASLLARRAEGSVKGEQCQQGHHFPSPPASPCLAASAPARALALYVAVSVIRLVVYLGARSMTSHVMADHIFLGASVVAMAHSEAVAAGMLMVISIGLGPGIGWGSGGGRLAKGLQRGGGGGGGRLITAAAVLVSAVGVLLAGGLIVLQCGDSYFTAAYFHTRSETFVAAFFGLVLCQSIILACVVVPTARSFGAAAASLLYRTGPVLGYNQEGAPAAADTVLFNYSAVEMSLA